MEAEYLYTIKYDSKPVCLTCACTKWHAIEKVFYRLALDIPNIDRRKIRAIKKKL